MYSLRFQKINIKVDEPDLVSEQNTSYVYIDCRTLRQHTRYVPAIKPYCYTLVRCSHMVTAYNFKDDLLRLCKQYVTKNQNLCKFACVSLNVLFHKHLFNIQLNATMVQELDNFMYTLPTTLLTGAGLRRKLNNKDVLERFEKCSGIHKAIRDLCDTYVMTTYVLNNADRLCLFLESIKSTTNFVVQHIKHPQYVMLT